MNHALLLGCILALLSPALRAQDAATAKNPADPGIRAQLDKLDYQYEVDEDNDYKLVFELEGDPARTQLVYVRSPVEDFGEHRVREIWSPAWRTEADAFPAEVANRLLEASHNSKLGAWVKQGNLAVFVVKLPADAGEQMLSDAIDAAIRSADEMEIELSDGKDEF